MFALVRCLPLRNCCIWLPRHALPRQTPTNASNIGSCFQLAGGHPYSDSSNFRRPSRFKNFRKSSVTDSEFEETSSEGFESSRPDEDNIRPNASKYKRRSWYENTPKYSVNSSENEGPMKEANQGFSNQYKDKIRPDIATKARITYPTKPKYNFPQDSQNTPFSKPAYNSPGRDKYSNDTRPFSESLEKFGNRLQEAEVRNAGARVRNEGRRFSESVEEFRRSAEGPEVRNVKDRFRNDERRSSFSESSEEFDRNSHVQPRDIRNASKNRTYANDLRNTKQGNFRQSFAEKLSTTHGYKNYNYGLSGLGKAPPVKKLQANEPAVNGEILYGIHPAILALTAGRRKFHKCYVQENLFKSERSIVQQLMSLIREKNVAVETCDKSVLMTLSQTRPHQGVCLDAEKLDYEPLNSNFEDALPSMDKPRLFVILDSIQDPMNLGAVIRTSHFLGVDKLFVVKQNSCPLTPVVSKSSAGAMEITKIYAIPDIIAFLEEYRNRGWDLLGTSTSAKSNPGQLVPLHDVSLQRDTILILGNEGTGLTEEIEAKCHRLLTIPSGKNLNLLVDSLNVSVAAGIVLHHLCRFKTSTKQSANGEIKNNTSTVET